MRFLGLPTPPVSYEILSSGRVHFIGICGIGLSGLAIILHQMGIKVEGSDLAFNANAERLRDKGIKLMLGEEGGYIDNGITCIVATSTVTASNPLIQKAINLGIPIYFKYDVLNFLAQQGLAIAITGAHGKTTSTCIVEEIIHRFLTKVPEFLEWKMIFMAGGIPKNRATNGYLAQHNASKLTTQSLDTVIFEADESDDTFAKVPANISLMTNVDKEHLDFYGSMNALLTRYKDSLHLAPDIHSDIVYRVICSDDKYLANLANKFRLEGSNDGVKLVTYGMKLAEKMGPAQDFNNSDDAMKRVSVVANDTNDIVEPDVLGYNICLGRSYCTFSIKIESELLGRYALDNLKLNLVGSHNVSNAIGAVTVALLWFEKYFQKHIARDNFIENKDRNTALDIELYTNIMLRSIKDALASFAGTKRRLEIISTDGGLNVVMDYAHHPTAIIATLTAAKVKFDRVFVIFEPHKFSRVQSLFEEHIDSLLGLEFLQITNIHPAGEKPIPGFGAKELVAAIETKAMLGNVAKHNNTQAAKNYVGEFISIQDTYDQVSKLLQINANKNNGDETCGAASKLANAIIFMGAGSKIFSLAHEFAELAANQNSTK